jgi:hypothetical protein
MKDPVRIGALVAAVILFSLFVYLILRDPDPRGYITVAVLLVFAVLATRLDDITNLNFGATGVRAELEKKLREAQATVTQLQRIAELFGQISVQQITTGNRWNGLSSKERREAISKIERELKAINVPEDRIREALSLQRNYDRLDYYYWVANALPAPPTQNQLNGFTSFDQVFPNLSPDTVPAIADVEAHLKRHDLTGEAMERLEDWKQYERDGTHRRLDQWDTRHDQPVPKDY